MKMLYTVIILLAICTACHAGDRFVDNHEIYIGYAPFCQHMFKHNPDHNETINAVMLSVDQWFITTFKNSHYDQTVAAGYTFRTRKFRPLDDKFFLRGDLGLGIMYGYEDHLWNVGGFSPAVAPALELGYDISQKYSVSLSAIVYPVAVAMVGFTF